MADLLENMNINEGTVRDHSKLDILCPICRGWYPDGASHSEDCSKDLELVLALATAEYITGDYSKFISLFVNSLPKVINTNTYNNV